SRRRARTSGSAVPSGPEGTSGGSGRREEARHRGQPIEGLISDMDAHAPPPARLLLGRPLSGLRLSLTEARSGGTILCRRRPHVPASVPWVQMEVKYCFLQDERWLVGCKFVQAQSWSVLRLFD